MPRLGMCSNNLNYLRNKTSRLHHVRRTYTTVKCKNKNGLEVLKSSTYISLFEPRQSNIFRGFKTFRIFLFLHFRFRIRASDVVET